VQGRRQAAALACELDEVFDAVERGATPVTLTDSIRRVVRDTRGTLGTRESRETRGTRD